MKKTECQFFALPRSWLWGIPPERMPFYEKSFEKYSARIWRILSLTGNFGKYDTGMPDLSLPRMRRKLRSFGFRIKQSARLFPVFPAEAPRRLMQGFLLGMSRLKID